VRKLEKKSVKLAEIGSWDLRENGVSITKMQGTAQKVQQSRLRAGGVAQVVEA
jgi:hypothetical protein